MPRIYVKGPKSFNASSKSFPKLPTPSSISLTDFSGAKYSADSVAAASSSVFALA